MSKTRKKATAAAEVTGAPGSAQHEQGSLRSDPKDASGGAKQVGKIVALPQTLEMPAFLYTIFISIFDGKNFPPACAGQWQLPAAPVQVPLPGRAGHLDSVGNDMAWGMEPARALLPWQEHLLTAETEVHACDASYFRRDA